MRNYIKVIGRARPSNKAPAEASPGPIIEQELVHFEDRDPDDVKRAIDNAREISSSMRSRGLIARTSVWKPAISVDAPRIGDISLVEAN